MNLFALSIIYILFFKIFYETNLLLKTNYLINKILRNYYNKTFLIHKKKGAIVPYELL